MRTLLSLLLAADANALAVGAAPGKCSVWVVGCGLPKRGMGWYHAKQIVDDDVPSASLTAVVEPWFLGAGADSAPGAAFGEWASEMEAKGVAMHASVDALPSSAEDAQPTLALISGRTADNPRLLKEVRASKRCGDVLANRTFLRGSDGSQTPGSDTQVAHTPLSPHSHPHDHLSLVTFSFFLCVSTLTLMIAFHSSP